MSVFHGARAIVILNEVSVVQLIATLDPSYDRMHEPRATCAVRDLQAHSTGGVDPRDAERRPHAQARAGALRLQASIAVPFPALLRGGDGGTARHESEFMVNCN